MAKLPLPLGSNQGEYGWDGTERLVNCYSRIVEDSNGKHVHVVGSDGLSLFSTLPVSTSFGVRAMLPTSDYLWCVVGSAVLAVTPGGSGGLIGAIPSTSGPVYMAQNRRNPAQIGIVDNGGAFYVIQTGPSVTFSQVTDPDYYPASSLAFMNGYFILPGENGRWAITGEDNATAIDPLEFAYANSDADQIVRAATRDDEVVLFGEFTTQFYRDVGAPDFPFQPTRTSQFGCFAPMSVADVGGTLMWVGRTKIGGKMVRVLDGYSGQVVSNPAVERFLDAITDNNELTAFAWTRRGHTFYALNSNSGSWVYDLKTQQWHERESYNKPRWIASCHAVFAGKHIVGHYNSPYLYEMSPTYEDEAGQPLIMTVQMANNPGRTVYDNLVVEAMPGVGLNTPSQPQNLDPVVMVDWSDDGGREWSQQRSLALGRQGNTGLTLRTHRLGTSREQGRSFRFSVSANVAKLIRGVRVNEKQVVR